MDRYHVQLRTEALAILGGLTRNPNRLEAMEQADDVIAVYRAVVGPPDGEISRAYERATAPANAPRAADAPQTSHTARRSGARVRPRATRPPARIREKSLAARGAVC